MVATPDFGGATYDDSDPLTGSDEALGLVDFSCFRTSSVRTCRTLLRQHRKMGGKVVGAGVRDRR